MRTATTSDAMAIPVSIPGLNPPEDELSPLLLLGLPLVLVGSEVGLVAEDLRQAIS